MAWQRVIPNTTVGLIMPEYLVSMIPGLVGMFVLGGITGLTLAASQDATQCHDAYSTVVHPHRVLSIHTCGYSYYGWWMYNGGVGVHWHGTDVPYQCLLR